MSPPLRDRRNGRLELRRDVAAGLHGRRDVGLGEQAARRSASARAELRELTFDSLFDVSAFRMARRRGQGRRTLQLCHSRSAAERVKLSRHEGDVIGFIFPASL